MLFLNFFFKLPFLQELLFGCSFITCCLAVQVLSAEYEEEVITGPEGIFAEVRYILKYGLVSHFRLLQLTLHLTFSVINY